MPDKTFDLGDYVQVKDRIAALYELFGTARITTTYELTSEPDDRPKVICRALVYRTPDDPHPSTGTSWMYLPGGSSFTKGSEIENAETSAIGRAIGFLGILIDKSIASANEIAGKQDDGRVPAPREGSLIGVAEVAKAPHDFEVRQTPEGPSIGFKLTEGRQQVRVFAYGPLATQIEAFREAVEGKRIEVYGSMTQETWEVAKGTDKARSVPYTRLHAVRITGPEGLDLPMIDEAPSLPLFSEDEDALLEKAIGA